MSRHRNMKFLIEDDNDDYNSDEDLDDDEYCIATVRKKVSKKTTREQVIEALNSNSWNINAAIKLLKTPLPKPAKEEEKKEIASPQKFPAAKAAPRKSSEPKHDQLLDPNLDYPEVFLPEPNSSELPTINLVIIGHVDAGKSTLMGHLLYKLGHIDPRTMSKYEQESRNIGKESFHFAWVLDQDAQERQRGVTIDIGFNSFSTADRHIVLLDAPGHRDFVPKMISGAAQADAAILVIDSSVNEFERGFTGEKQHGQTKEHAFIARSLGVTSLIVAVNKLDNVEWSEQRFHFIRHHLNEFLRKVGYHENSVKYVPVSGLLGVNLQENGVIEWYNGDTLLETINSLPVPKRQDLKPLRMCVVDCYKLAHGTILGQIISGKIESGRLSLNDRVYIEPSRASGVVRNIENSGRQVEKARAGDNVDVALRELEGDFSGVGQGHVAHAGDFPVPQISRFLLKVITFDIAYPVTKGQMLIMHVQSYKVGVTVKRMVSQTDPSSGGVLKQGPRLLPKFSAGVIEVEADSKVCLEKYSNCSGLGRVTLREGTRTIMAGIVVELLN